MSSTYPPAVAHRAFGSKAVRVGRLGATAASSTVSPAGFVLVSDESKELAVFAVRLSRSVRWREQRGFDIRKDILGAHVPMEFSPCHQACRLRGTPRRPDAYAASADSCIARSPVASTAVMFRRRRMPTGDMSLIWLVGVVASQR
jgi:hypothetical protein